MKNVYQKLNKKGLEALEKKQFPKALEIYREITSKYPDRFLPWFNMGIAAQFTSDLHIAAEAFEKAVSLKPADAPSLNELGLVRFKQSDLDAAQASIEKALELDPENAVYLNNLGVIAFNRPDYDKARTFFESAVKLEPEYIDAWFNLRDCCEMLNDTEAQAEAGARFEELNNRN